MLAVLIPAYVSIPVSVYASADCECVLYLREMLGVNIHGNAWNIAANIPKDQVKEGDVVLFSYAHTGHAALITDVVQARPERPEIYLTITESNYHHCTPDTRTIPLDDPAIRGFYRPPQLSTPVIDISL